MEVVTRQVAPVTHTQSFQIQTHYKTLLSVDWKNGFTSHKNTPLFNDPYGHVIKNHIAENDF